MKIWQVGITGITIAVAVVMISGVYVLRTNHLQLFTVDSDAAAPGLVRGDLNVGKHVAPSQLSVGDVISYQSDSGGVETARVLSINSKNLVITVASGNGTNSSTYVQPGKVVARSVASVPLAGYLLSEIRHLGVLIGFVYIPILLVLIREVRHFGRATWRKPYTVSSD